MKIKLQVEQLRVTIACIWSAFALLSILLVVLAQLRRGDVIKQYQILPVVEQITAIWLPPLTCFCTFWFTDAEGRPERSSEVSQERVIFAIGLTSMYLLIVNCFLLYPLFVDKYDLPNERDLSSQISEVAKYALLLSPLALAPVGYLTRRPEHNIDDASRQP
jgi:hypothetical protein